MGSLEPTAINSPPSPRLHAGQIAGFVSASLIGQVGDKGVRREISMIRVIAPTLLATIADRAMQMFGAMGVSPDTPLADLYTAGRVLRFANGPDEVHLQLSPGWR